ncbi:Tetratricopeptide repeat-containing protein [Oribacterium sp. KHPX15]|uniref:tetratricopeptide repeat protein n=1 Tax=Oribacterium sp. KHPX15 TaxID=1855342 RepID=UPI0008948277|nr:tetratricopeptide repeat protein [Oribacterium sp. KHPX15]SDZ96186.1 Tetratricopeptide repeat-containing protein [Oribacterium sp. KHPX15]
MEKKSSPIIIISVLTGILLAALVGMLVYFNLPAQRIRRMLKTANKFLAEENYEEAILTLQKMIEIDPKNENLYVMLAGTYEKTGDTDKEIRLLQGALDVLPEAEDLSEALEQAYTNVTLSEREGTYKDPVSLVLDAPKDSKIYYRVTDAGVDDTYSADDPKTGSKEKEYSEPISLEENGNYSIEYYAVSKNGYEGEHKTATYVIELDESKYPSDESWKQAYIDVINGGEYFNTFWGDYDSGFEDPDDESIDPEAKVWNYTYVNDDNIPEITHIGHYSNYFLSYFDGEVQGFGGGKIWFEFKPGTEFIISHLPREQEVFKIGPNGLESIQGFYTANGSLGEFYYVDDTEVTEDQYDSAFSQYYDPEMKEPEGKYSTKEIIEIINNL